MKIKPIGLITLGAFASTGLFATIQAPIPPVSAQKYIEIEKQRIDGYESGVKAAEANYEKLLTDDVYKKILNDIVYALDRARKPYASLELADPHAVTPQEQATIDQLNKREKELLSKLHNIETLAKKWAAKKHIEYPKNLISY